MPNISTTNLKIPYIAVLIITELIIAETLLGAEGCAIGSHICKGTIPAFVPNPIKKHKKIIDLENILICIAATFIASKFNPFEKVPQYKSPEIIKTVPK
jgi:hypothetical protein